MTNAVDRASFILFLYFFRKKVDRIEKRKLVLVGQKDRKKTNRYKEQHYPLEVLCSCGSVVEHCVSSAKGCGFNSQGTHIQNMYSLDAL